SVVGVRVVNQQVFAGIGNHLECMAARTASGAGISGHGTEVQAQAPKDARGGVVHSVVAGLGVLGIAGEGASIPHGEFAATHQAKAGTALVAEFGLNVVEVDGQLAPAVDFVAGNVRDHFFGGRLQHEVALVAILDSQQFVTIF